jgi:hypothetical protein
LGTKNLKILEKKKTGSENMENIKKANIIILQYQEPGTIDYPKGPSHQIRFAWKWYGSIGLA